MSEIASVRSLSHKHIKDALRIRMVEEKFLNLFSTGHLNGTVHTCVGQEFSAVAFAGQVKKKDFIFSNHRCHGHYLCFTGDTRGLLAELLGKSSGTCGGIGSSQHLCRDNFFSNGIQGGIMPVAAGYALANKLRGGDEIGIVFIGDGTLGEGVLYETMNIISKWKIPLLIVCENNSYAQSTPQSLNLSGEIISRPSAFGIQTYEGDTWNPEVLLSKAKEAIDFVRIESKPAFFLVETYRLNAHSKGDDDREIAELDHFRKIDYLNKFKDESPEYYSLYKNAIDIEIEGMVAEILKEGETSLDQYFIPDTSITDDRWQPLSPINKRQVELLNAFFHDCMSSDDKVVMLGEDIHSPYGGAFKVTKGLSTSFPDRVFTTPISEAAITGISNGLALNGFKPFVEIMFGDFITLAFDQIVNHASKFRHMFNGKVNCPVVIRTPMGGRRGYGPTHSQTLDKFLIGIDNVKTVAINTFFDPGLVYSAIHKQTDPVIVIENKVDYGKKIFQQKLPRFTALMNNQDFPVVHLRPAVAAPTITIVAYGGMADIVATLLEDIFENADLIPELIIPTLISALPIDLILSSVKRTGRLLVIEEGSQYGGIGSELGASLSEKGAGAFKFKRISAFPVPIPSVKSLELTVLPEKERIIDEITRSFS